MSIISNFLSFLFVFIFNFQDVLSAPTRQLCHPEQRDALLEFKNEFEIGEPSYGCYSDVKPKTESWVVNNSDCCYWDGVKCDAKSGKVIELDLTCSRLHGRFHSNSKIFMVQSLRSLDLSVNDLRGQIPFSIGNLSQLTFLSLSGNNFDGEIPSSLGNVSYLTDLKLYNNYLDGEIPSSFGNLNNLATLDVRSNRLSGSFPLALLNLTKLSFLSLSHNQLTGALPSSLLTLPSLEFIRLGSNNLNGTLEFGNISSSSKLGGLFLGNNNFRGSIPISISKLANLEGLDLSYLNTQGSVDLSIFSHLKSLQYLDTSYLNTTTTIDLNAFLSVLKRLSHLDLSGNRVSATNKNSFSNPPSQLIERLFLSGCGIIVFPEFLRTVLQIQVLDISNNKVKGQVPGWLQVLVLHSNEFHGILQYHPKVAIWFPQLRIIDISHNLFTGTLPSDFSMYWSAMSSEGDRSELKYIGDNTYYRDSLVLMNKGVELAYTRIHTLLAAIDISGNKLRGEIPKSIGLLKNLIVLNLSSNGFSGNIHSYLANLTKLESLDLSHNKLSGQIPPALGVLTSLSKIVVSHNQLIGPIPQGTQFQTQDASSFEDNLGLCGRPLSNKCRDKGREKPQESEEEEEEELFSWTAAAIALTPGVIIGFTIGHIVITQKPHLLVKIFGVTSVTLGIVTKWCV
ncbi:unnamed protein product [Microthlaspi erraticum]|uniref:Uncharacterized protein n=1 Tax=Microthlaspi erraticum TaxID=1685480 RepID=A0A6D2LFN0_9BRAS|nr:unnamed protein product [Microthlaspi erraticum]